MVRDLISGGSGPSNLLRAAKLLLAVLAGASALTPVSSQQNAAPVDQKFVILANGRNVGQIDAAVSDSGVKLDYRVSDNGRGPSTHEEIGLGAGGLPTTWTITGTSLIGAAMHETFAWKNGHAKWEGEADKGDMPASQPILYLSNDASPWALGLYARNALASPGHHIPIAPHGTIRAEDLGVALPDDKARSTWRLYRVSGAWMQPQYVVLDRAGQLVSTLSDGMLVLRAGNEAVSSRLNELYRSSEYARMRDLQATLAHRYAAPVRFVHVHVFDTASGTTGPLQTVVVHGDRIAAVLRDDEPFSRDDEVIVDGAGGTLIPGLRDMHSHTNLDSNIYNLAAGVTSTRDMGNNNDFLLNLLPRIASGELPGPRITPNGFLEGVSPYSASDGFLATTLPEALSDVRWYADRGYWQLKIYNSVNPAWVKPLAAEAHRRGMGVTGHIPAFTTADQMIRDGYDEIAHINQLMFEWVLRPDEDTRTTLRIKGLNRLAGVDLDSARVQDTLRLMREHHTVLDTTLCTQERLALSRAGTAQRGELPYLDHVPIAYQRYRKRNFVDTPTPADDQGYEAAVQRMLELTKRLHDQGNRLMPGTDDDYGFALHRELELYALAGIPAGEVLRMDTLVTAQYLKQDQDLGSIERGKLADLVLLPADPTQDISVVRRASLVMRGGTIYFPDEIYKALDIRPFSIRPTIRVGTLVTSSLASPGFPSHGDEED